MGLGLRIASAKQLGLAVAGLLLLAVSSWLTFGQPPDLWFYAGAPLIILSGLYIWLRERRLQKALVAPTMAD